MIDDSKEKSMNTFINDALRGKPYLDIDRVITESRHKKGQEKRKNKT
ncbi:hypothetical protein [Oceanobacillus sp. Castelsardo]|nr:hypothetical protein [Oceanobacillus sp. Castelsardo]